MHFIDCILHNLIRGHSHRIVNKGFLDGGLSFEKPSIHMF